LKCSVFSLNISRPKYQYGLGQTVAKSVKVKGLRGQNSLILILITSKIEWFVTAVRRPTLKQFIGVRRQLQWPGSSPKSNHLVLVTYPTPVKFIKIRPQLLKLTRGQTDRQIDKMKIQPRPNLLQVIKTKENIRSDPGRLGGLDPW